LYEQFILIFSPCSQSTESPPAQLEEKFAETNMQGCWMKLAVSVIGPLTVIDPDGLTPVYDPAPEPVQLRNTLVALGLS